MPDTPAPSRAKLVAAFAAVYIIWGSTYLAILYVLESIPPFLGASARFLIAGSIMLAWSRASRMPRPTRNQILMCAMAGVLMLSGGNGAVVWAEQRVPSGVAALLVATVPCWMVLLDWLRPGGLKPTVGVVAGLVLGLAGLGLLVGPEALLGGGRVDHLGALVLVVGSLSWAFGSIYSRGRAFPDPRTATALQMLAGGVGLLIAGSLAGDWSALAAETPTLKSLLALGYLIVFGSIVAFSAYVWLLRVASPARVSTYAYVNPLVAVLLGWAFANEALTMRMLIAAAVIIAGVVLITMKGTREPKRIGVREQD